jgi:hypothetical protein
LVFKPARAEFITVGKECTMKVLKAVFTALPLLASLLLLPASANASTLSSGSGSFTGTGEVISVRQVDGNTIITATEVQTLTGALNGTRLPATPASSPRPPSPPREWRSPPGRSPGRRPAGTTRHSAVNVFLRNVRCPTLQQRPSLRTAKYRS